MLSNFILALSFLTRMVPARPADDRSIAGTLPWFCPVGLILGMVMIIPGLLGIAQGYPFVQAWIIVGLGFFLTRGLHWDGWADVWDAWGSQARGDRFWAVVKDSHAGAFGVAGLVLGLGGQILIMGEVIKQGQWEVIVWAVVLGRFGAAALAWHGRAYPRPGLGEAFLAGAGTKAVSFNLAVLMAFAVFFIPLYMTAISLVLLVSGILFLYRLGRKNNGINGDFLGSAIIWGEISALMAFILIP